MFDVGFPELLLIAVVALLVIGPERMPEALRTLGLWMGRMRRSFMAVKQEIEKEIGMDEIRRQLHNESVMEELKRIEREVRTTAQRAAGTEPTPPAPTTSPAPGTIPAAGTMPEPAANDAAPAAPAQVPHAPADGTPAPAASAPAASTQAVAGVERKPDA